LKLVDELTLVKIVNMIASLMYNTLHAINDTHGAPTQSCPWTCQGEHIKPAMDAQPIAKGQTSYRKAHDVQVLHILAYIEMQS